MIDKKEQIAAFVCLVIVPLWALSLFCGIALVSLFVPVVSVSAKIAILAIATAVIPRFCFSFML